MHVSLNFGWMAASAVVPAALGLIVAFLVWRIPDQDEAGTLAGTGVVMLIVIVLILREFSSVIGALARCRDAGVPCVFEPEPALRYAIVAGIGMVQILAVFVIGLIVPARMRRRALRSARA